MQFYFVSLPNFMGKTILVKTQVERTIQAAGISTAEVQASLPVHLSTKCKCAGFQLLPLFFCARKAVVARSQRCPSLDVWEAGAAEMPALKLRDRLDCL